MWELKTRHGAAQVRDSRCLGGWEAQAFADPAELAFLLAAAVKVDGIHAIMLCGAGLCSIHRQNSVVTRFLFL